ncbi:MAG: TolC family protein, partial [Desulfopila sp.]|nr:TolC family protein [Desulfopila sp.]
RARKKAAHLLYKEKETAVEEAALAAQSMLVQTWISYLTALEGEKILRVQLETGKRMLEIIELRLSQGTGSGLDLLQQKSRLAALERQLPGVNSEKLRAANSYSILMGQYPRGDILLQDKLPPLQPLNTLISPHTLLVQRPDLQSGYLALQAADYQVAAAIADRLPRLAFQIITSESGSSLSTIGNDSVFRFAANILAPVFDWGRLKLQAQRKQSEASELLAVLQHDMLEAVREVEDTLSREQGFFREKQLLEAELAIAEETVAKARLRYVNGKETFLPVLIALTELQTLQQENIYLRRNMLTNRAHLLRALGAKWSDHRENE